MAMTTLMILILSFAFVNMFFMFATLNILLNKARQICDKWDFTIIFELKSF